MLDYKNYQYQQETDPREENENQFYQEENQNYSYEE